MDELIIFYGMSVVLAMVGMVLVIVGLSYHRLSRRYSLLYEDLVKINADVKSKHEEIILNAQVKAQQILSDASKKSQTMIEASDVFSKEYKDEFRARLLQVLAKEEVQFKQMYDQVKDQSALVVETVSKDIKSTLSGQVAQLNQTMVTELQKGIEEYKKQSYARLEKEVHEVVGLIARDVLKKSLDQEDQRRLVIDALTEARQHNVF